MNETSLETKGEYGAQSALFISGIEIKKKVSGKKGKVLKSLDKIETPGEDADIQTHMELAPLYRKSLKTAFPNEYFAPLTAKEVGQLKQFGERCPPGKARFILEYAVMNWCWFCSQATDREGAINPPSMPVIGTLLLFVNSATAIYADMIAEAEKDLAKVAEKAHKLAKKPIVHEPPSPKVFKDEDKPATLEEVGKSLGYD